MRPKNGHPYKLNGMFAVSHEHADFCRRRVGGLLDWSGASTTNLADLLANAYALGLSDAVNFKADRPLAPGGGFRCRNVQPTEFLGAISEEVFRREQTEKRADAIAREGEA